MTTIITADMIAPALDWAVAKALGLDVCIGHFGPLLGRGYKWACVGVKKYNPSADWAKGGPIIEREKLHWGMCEKDAGMIYLAYAYKNREVMRGPTPLVAAMRCYVSRCLGYRVEVPEELA